MQADAADPRDPRRFVFSRPEGELMVRDVVIFDTTLRDGEQAPGNTMTPEEKMQVARQLDALNVDVIEAGFPAASAGDYRGVQEIAEQVRRPVLAALARCTDKDIDLAGEALRPAARGRIHVFISTSDIHLEHKLKIGRDDCLELARAAVRRARRFTDDVEFSAEDASRTDLEYLCRVVEAAIAEGATTINLPDTVGFALPAEYEQIFRAVRERVPGAERITLSAHCHDDLGLAVANSLAAIAAGAGQVECTVNGIGERAGNAALEEIVMASHVRPQVAAFRCNVETRELYRTSRLLSHVTGVFPQPNKAIVGRNAFAHEAGIHQHGVMQNGLTYEIMRPETVGVPHSRLVLGKHSGRHALERRARGGGQRGRPDRRHLRGGERDRGPADRGGEPRRAVRHARPRQPGAGVAPGAGERQVPVGARRIDRYRRGVRPRARQCAQQGALCRAARGRLAQLRLPLGGVTWASSCLARRSSAASWSKKAWTRSGATPEARSCRSTTRSRMFPRSAISW